MEKVDLRELFLARNWPELELASEQFLREKGEGPDDAEFGQWHLAAALGLLERYAEAENAFKLLVTASPWEETYWASYIRSMCDQGPARKEEALATGRRALEKLRDKGSEEACHTIWELMADLKEGLYCTDCRRLLPKDTAKIIDPATFANPEEARHMLDMGYDKHYTCVWCGAGAFVGRLNA